MPSESYLDTGNRGAFVNGGGAVDLHPDFSPCHWTETCVPLVQDGPILTALRERLISRALSQGWRQSREAQPVLLIDGQPVPPTRREGKIWAYPIPRGAKVINLCSHADVPAELLPDSQDRRKLGLWIDDTTIVRNGQRREVRLGDRSLTHGWHEVERSENGAWRWTDGNAGVAIKGSCQLEMSVGCSLPSWEFPAAAQNERILRTG